MMVPLNPKDSSALPVDISVRALMTELSQLEKKVDQITSLIGHGESKINPEFRQSLCELSGRINVIKERIGEMPAQKEPTGLFYYFSAHRSVVLTEKFMAELPKNHPFVVGDLQKRIEQTAKIIQSGSYGIIESSEKTFEGSLIITKDFKGNLDYLIPLRLLGNGATASAWSVKSVNIGKEFVVKVAAKIVEDVDAAAVKEDFDNETMMTTFLNREGKHRGLPAARTTLTQSASSQVISTGDLYSRGDLANQGHLIAISNLLQKTPLELKSLSLEELKQEIRPRIQEESRRALEVDLKIITLKNEFIELYPATLQEGEVGVSALEKREGIFKELAKYREMRESGLILNTLLQIIHSPEDQSIIENDLTKIKNYLINGEEIIPETLAELHQQQADNLEKLLLRKITKEQKKPLTENSELKSRIVDLLEGMRYMHQSMVIHGDIKPANFLWNEEEAVIADFGTAKRLDGNYLAPMGSRAYMTPSYSSIQQQYRKNKDYDNWFRVGIASDMRAMGLSIAQIYGGCLIPGQTEMYNESAYEEMKLILQRNGLDLETAGLMVKLCKPFIYKKEEDLPKEFPLPLNNEEYARLMTLLSGG